MTPKLQQSQRLPYSFPSHNSGAKYNGVPNPHHPSNLTALCGKKMCLINLKNVTNCMSKWAGSWQNRSRVDCTQAWFLVTLGGGGGVSIQTYSYSPFLQPKYYQSTTAGTRSDTQVVPRVPYFRFADCGESAEMVIPTINHIGQANKSKPHQQWLQPD